MTKGLFRRGLAWLLVLVLLFSAVPMTALATGTEEGMVTEETEEEIWGGMPNPNEEPDGEPDEEPEEGEEPGEGEPEDIYANPVDVDSAQALEEALAQQVRAIRITADFALDRTFISRRIRPCLRSRRIH